MKTQSSSQQKQIVLNISSPSDSWYKKLEALSSPCAASKLPDLIMNAETMGRLPAAIVGTALTNLSHSNHVPTNYAPAINGN
jgi:hypothetical protein